MIIYPETFPSQEHLDAYTSARAAAGTGLYNRLTNGDAKDASWEWIVDMAKDHRLAAIVQWSDGSRSLQTVANLEIKGGTGGKFREVADWDEALSLSAAGKYPYGTVRTDGEQGYTGINPPLGGCPDITAGSTNGGHPDSYVRFTWDFTNWTLTRSALMTYQDSVEEVLTGLVVGFRTTDPAQVHFCLPSRATKHTQPAYHSMKQKALLTDGYWPDVISEYNSQLWYNKQITIDMRSISMNRLFEKVYARHYESAKSDIKGDVLAVKGTIRDETVARFGDVVINPLAIVTGRSVDSDEPISCVTMMKKRTGVWLDVDSSVCEMQFMSLYNVKLNDNITVCGNFLQEVRGLDLLEEETATGWCVMSADNPAIVDSVSRWRGTFALVNSGVVSAPLMKTGAYTNTLRDSDKGEISTFDGQAVLDDNVLTDAEKIANAEFILDTVDMVSEDEGVVVGSGVMAVKQFIQSRIKSLVKARV